MINYVCGFYFNHQKDKVALIRKNRPHYLSGLFTGVGGKIEPKCPVSLKYGLDVPETPLMAMIREFQEEAGVYTDDWENFCTIIKDDYTIHVFKSVGDLDKVKTITDEKIKIINVKSLPDNCTADCSWLINMAINNKYNCKVYEV